MSKHPIFPTLYDEVLQISITNLKKWGYLIPDQIKRGTITWSINGNATDSISILVNTLSGQPSIELNYTYRNDHRNYKIQLVSVPSNLNKGLIMYFLCPQTKKRCRKMYSIDGYFLHREAFQHCMYKSQTYSKQWRVFKKGIETAYKLETLYKQLYMKHSKIEYAGKPTKRYLRIMERIHQNERDLIL